MNVIKPTIGVKSKTQHEKEKEMVPRLFFNTPFHQLLKNLLQKALLY
jgi:hypothetical protein